MFDPCIAASSKFAPEIAISHSRQQMVTNIRVNFILDDKMLQYCHVFMLPTFNSKHIHVRVFPVAHFQFKAYTCQQYVCVLSAILATNGQTLHKYALMAVNSPMRLIKG